MAGSAGVPRLLDDGDKPRAVEVMASAFHQDPLWIRLVPNEAKRAGHLRRFFEFFMSTMLAMQEVYGLGNPLEAVAIWDTPEPRERPPRPPPEWAFIKLVFSSTFRVASKTSKIFDRLEQMRKLHAPGRHFYLVSIGVLPASQGKGLASRLIRYKLADADARGFGTYVETMTEMNVPIYEHFGFELKEKWDLPKTNLSTWAMYRAPLKLSKP